MKLTNECHRAVTVEDQCGFHMLAAQRVAGVANHFKSALFVGNRRHCTNATNILGLLMLAAMCGSVLQLHAYGEDAESALDEVARMISPGIKIYPDDSVPV